MESVIVLKYITLLVNIKIVLHLPSVFLEGSFLLLFKPLRNGDSGDKEHLSYKAKTTNQSMQWTKATD